MGNIKPRGIKVISLKLNVENAYDKVDRVYLDKNSRIRKLWQQMEKVDEGDRNGLCG